ncbi:MAG TPA: YciI family protein [Inquilinus sp.]|nr:YciI family protein [Inquilinus sp.]
MKYLCLVYMEQRTMDALSPVEDKDLTRDSRAYDEELRRSGHYLVSQALHPTSSATTVRVRNGRVSTTDGPFAETKEHLGGFILIEARDLNEAIQVAAGIPLAKLGSIEVRPVMGLG